MTKEFKRLPLKIGLSKRFLAFLAFLVKLVGILETNTIHFLRSDYNLRASFSVYMVAFPVYRPGHYSWRLVSTHALQCSVGQWILKIIQSKMHFHIIFICGLALSLILAFLLVFFQFLSSTHCDIKNTSPQSQHCCILWFETTEKMSTNIYIWLSNIGKPS